MKKLFYIFFLVLVIPACLFSAACPAVSCPADRETPVAEYLFENNLQDTSGHGLNAENSNPSLPVTFHENIGGRPGYCVSGFTAGSYTGVFVPSCVIYRDEGEFEWYEYVTASPAAQSNNAIRWEDGAYGFNVFSGDGSVFGPESVRLAYTFIEDGLPRSEQFLGEWLKLNQWQHFRFQWGSFGTRLEIDGVVVSGSFNIWAQGTRPDTVFGFGVWVARSELGFAGYLDDLRFWPCAGHGTVTITPTAIGARTNTVTLTPTITPTGTETGTPELTLTSTVTETRTMTPSRTDTPEPTLSLTAAETLTSTLTPTITLTTTVTPTPSAVKLINLFPNPASKKITVVFTSAAVCPADFSYYSLSGEKTGSVSILARAGLNSLVVSLKNSSGVDISSGTYIYKLELRHSGTPPEILLGKFSVIR
jgi:hypothetical protein